jgi:hypothetical protein
MSRRWTSGEAPGLPGRRYIRRQTQVLKTMVLAKRGIWRKPVVHTPGGDFYGQSEAPAGAASGRDIRTFEGT